MWFYRGWKDYTQEGFLEAEKKFNPGDLDVDLKGKSYMITGEPKSSRLLNLNSRFSLYI